MTLCIHSAAVTISNTAQRLPQKPVAEFWSIGKALTDLRDALDEAALKNYPAAYGHPQGAIKAAVWHLEEVQRRQQRTVKAPVPVPDYSEPRITITFDVPVSQVEVYAVATEHEDKDEHFGTPCLHRSTEIDVSDVDVSTLPPGWSINEYDEDKAIKLWESRQ